MFELAGEADQEEQKSDGESSEEEQKDAVNGEQDEKLAEGNILKPESNKNVATAFKRNEKDDQEESLKDQGFTRAKILIIVGFRHMAFDIVQNIVHLVNSSRGQWKGVKGRKKFKQQFGDEETSFDDDFRTGL